MSGVRGPDRLLSDKFIKVKHVRVPMESGRDPEKSFPLSRIYSSIDNAPIDSGTRPES